MSVKLLPEHHLEFLSLKGGCTGLSESTHITMPHCWKSHVPAQMCMQYYPVGQEFSLGAWSDSAPEIIRSVKPTGAVNFDHLEL